jgi:cell division protease FtsH
MIARGVGGLGYTMQMPLEDRYLLRKRELSDRLAVMLGGRSAEEVVFDEISTGAQNDLAKATELARSMVLDYGMSEEIGPLSFPRQTGDSDSPPQFFGKPWSETTNREIDMAIKELVSSAHETARDLISQHQDALGAVADALLDKEALEREELSQILEEYGIEIEKQFGEDSEENEVSEQQGQGDSEEVGDETPEEREEQESARAE